VTQNKTSQPPRIGSYPDLLRKEFIAALVSLAALFILAALIDAPVGGSADPAGLPAEHVKAPWIFVGIQQMLRYFPAIIAGVVFPAAALLIIAFAPFSSSARRRLYVSIFMFLTVTALILTIWGYLS
jgi:quinol-cytochrome oxidoreductase complex cytochrome b subunit